MSVFLSRPDQYFFSTASSARFVKKAAEKPATRKRMSLVGLRNESLEFCGILFGFLIY